MALLRWIGFAFLLLMIVGFVYAFVRHGTKIKPDPENKPENPDVIRGGGL